MTAPIALDATVKVVVLADDAGVAVRVRDLLGPDLCGKVAVVVLGGAIDVGALQRVDPVHLAAAVREAVRGAAAPAGAAAEARRLRKRPLVLVVEDDEFSHQLVSSMLINEDIDLEFEPDGNAALDRIRTLAPDMVLMDINLPGVDGVAITQRLKAEPGLASIPVVMLTSEARRETLIRSVEAGAADFIVKPFSREALIAKIDRYLPAVG